MIKSKKINSKKRKKVMITALVLVTVAIVGFIGYAVYGTYKLNQLNGMTFQEMLTYTTSGNQDAVITVGIMQDGEITYTVYGENGAVLPQEEHIYEIGSITKTFNASLLSKAISEGKISLSDSIDKYLDIPEKEYYPTMERLVTHTSGYKGYYLESPMVSNTFQGRNDFYGITGEMLISRIGKIDLEDRAYSFKYSNFGMAVLGAVLEQVYGEEYTPLMNAYIQEELSLHNTKISEGNGDLANYWEWQENDAYMPAGALESTITDMMQYAKAQMEGMPDYLLMAQEPLIDVDTSNSTNAKMGINIDSVGMSWMIDNHNKTIWHNGGTGNYNSYICISPEEQIAVVILSNLPPEYKIPATVMGVEFMNSLQKQ